MSEQSERMEITSTALLARTETFLASLSSLCPSDEGMGGRAPLQAFVAKGFECRCLLADIREHLANKLMTGLDREAKEQAQQAIMDYTRFQLYSALHIPAKYILDAACPTAPDAGELASRRLQRLCDELKQRGYLRLDKDGNPCVLSGENWPFVGREINDIRKELEDAKQTD